MNRSFRAEIGDLERLQMILSSLPDEGLIRALYRIRERGRNDWPCEAMWNTFVASFLFEHPTVEALLRELHRNKQLRDICGIKPHAHKRSDGTVKVYTAPSESAYSKFLKNLMECKTELKKMFEILVRYMYDHLEGFGEDLMVDGKAIQSFATKLSDNCKSGNRGEHDADSMGSFLCRLYVSRYPDDGYVGAIFMGTGGANKAAGAGILAAKIIGTIKGKKHKSGLLNKMAFGTYNKRFEGRTAFDWLTRDTAIVDKYIADPNCGYLFTVQGMADLISVNAASNDSEWYNAVPKHLPILLVSGGEDPVGDYGAGVKSVADLLKSTGHSNVTLKLYPGCRHEVLNETQRREVMEDLLSWIEKKC